MAEIVFILYRPGVPGNVGSSARALKTMGFGELRLIAPCDYLSDEALMLAHGSHDILRDASVFDTFEDAVSDIDFLIGTTSKNRLAKADYLSPSEAFKIVTGKRDKVGKVAVLFGTEESGLSNDILSRCDVASTIALKQPYPSLNLSQSVMLYAYEFSSVVWEAPPLAGIDTASYATLKNRVKQLLARVGIPEEMPVYNRILERLSFLGADDINLFHSVTSRVMNTLTGKTGKT